MFGLFSPHTLRHRVIFRHRIEHSVELGTSVPSPKLSPVMWHAADAPR